MPLSRPSRFAHVVYRTRRFDEMLRWYQTVFDARIQHRNGGLAFLTYDDEHHRFAFVDMSVFRPDGDETERRGEIGVDHVAYTFDSLTDLLENYATLRQEGVLPYWCVHHGITASLYYADPDGNQMEFQLDSFETSDEADAFIAEHWEANPLGVEFDPDDWLARLCDGAPESALLRRSVNEPVSPLRGELARLLAAE